MVHNPYIKQQHSTDPFDDGISPVIDPATVYQADPEINFDNVKEPQTSESSDQARDAFADQPADKDETQAEDAPALCPRCAEAEKGRLLAMADLENARKRLTREKEDFVKFAGEKIIGDILPALDNLDLALAYAPENAECKNFVVGVDMTRKLMLDTLSRHGLEAIGTLGEPFDPARHEAVEMVEHPDYESGQICGLINKGYRLKDRLIRPARVKVCKNG